jgi:hypothetical protein
MKKEVPPESSKINSCFSNNRKKITKERKSHEGKQLQI